MPVPTRALPRFARHLIVLVAVIAVRLAFGSPAGAQDGPILPANQPELGLIYDGLAVGAAGTPCEGMFAIKTAGADACTHGPDPAPPGVDIAQSVAPLIFPAEVGPLGIQCEGNGTSGKRTQVLYVRASDKPDRYATFLNSIRQWAADADQIYKASALETGGQRQLRFVHDSNCVLSVPNVVLSTTGDDTFSNTISQLNSAGYNRSDRKYMIFMDANIYCGIGNLYGDDSPGSGNWNNSGPSYGRSDAGCWSGRVAAHEHMHNLGGVQLSAPHTSGGYHCVDTYDVMCYSDSPNYPPMQQLCNSSFTNRFDCRDDDYYNTNPPAGSYLATHWNAATSQYLLTPVVINYTHFVFIAFVKR